MFGVLFFQTKTVMMEENTWQKIRKCCLFLGVTPSNPAWRRSRLYLGGGYMSLVANIFNIFTSNHLERIPILSDIFKFETNT